MAILCKVSRGDFTESIHVVFAVVVDGSESIVYSTGDPHYLTCVRSSLKPFQAAAAIREGSVDTAGFTDDEIALMCASHMGEDIHVQTAKRMIDKLGFDLNNYECGVHPSADRVSRYEQIKNGSEPNALNNNCSGKHAGMLALAKHLVGDPVGYTNLEHPVQQTIIRVLKEYTGLNDIQTGIDGCSAPTPFLALEVIARLFQLLSSGKFPELDRVFDAMVAHPYNISGKDQFDTLFIEALQGRGITKGGGESVRGISLKKKNGNSIGIALKVLDGHHRAMPLATMTLLKHLDLLSDKELTSLSRFQRKILRNHRNIEIGNIEAIVEM